jgi:trimeric autotransporter adhesin
MNPMIQLKKPTPLIVTVLSLACFGLAQAVVPPPDGGYPGGNTAEGSNALLSLTTGQNNTAVGVNSLSSTTTGGWNTAIGAGALRFNTGVENTAVGFQALFNNTTGISNTANGYQALFGNTDGFFNTANGAFALANNRIADNNTAAGYGALYRNTGMQNTANGAYALSSNTLGHDNTATGYIALSSNTTGIENTVTGVSALQNNTTGFRNTAVGSSALLSNDVGVANTAVGWRALQLNTGNGNSTAVGASALGNSTGFENTALGTNAGVNLTDGVFNIDIGAEVVGVAGESRTIRIGTTATQTRTFIAGISGATVAGGVGVIVGTNGKLGTVVSSARFKEAVQPMDKASEAILALKPVTFRYKKELDPEGIPQFGLVAEEVENVNPALVARDEQGKPYTVRYEAVNAMLLNEFLKEHRKVDKLEATVAQQRKVFETAIAQVKGQIQRVSAQLELNKPAPQTVLNNR